MRSVVRGDLTLAFVAFILMQCNAHAVTKGEKSEKGRKLESRLKFFFSSYVKEFLIERNFSQTISVRDHHFLQNFMACFRTG